MSDPRALRVRAFYDGFAAQYDRERYASPAQLKLDAAAKRAVLDLLAGRALRGARILDCGCGTGRFASLFAGEGSHVTGVDSSERMLAIARQRVPGADFFQGDVLDLKLEGRFDVVVCSQVLTHLHQYDVPLRNMRSVLAAGGTLVVDARNLLAPRNLAYLAQQSSQRRRAGQPYDPHFTTLHALKRAAHAVGLRVAAWRGISAGGTMVKARVPALLTPTLVVRMLPDGRA